MKISSIVQSVFHADSYNIYFERGMKLRTFRSVMEAFDLYEGRELSDAEMQGLVFACDLSGVEALAMAIIKPRPMTTRELIRKLTEKGVSREAAEATAYRFENLKLIDDLEYAKMLVRHYCARRHGINKIREEFMLRQVDFSLWDEALTLCAPPEGMLDYYFNGRFKGRPVSARDMARITSDMLKRGFLIGDINAASERYVTKTKRENARESPG